MKEFINGLKNGLNFRGRSSRRDFWMFLLVNFVLTIIFGLIGGLFNFPFLGNLFLIVTYIPFLAVGFRRMHDVGKNGFMIFVPIYNLVLLIREGDKFVNKYG